MRWEQLAIVMLISSIAILPFTSASHILEYSSEYDITQDGVLVSIYIKAEPTSEFLWRLPLDAQSIASETTYESEAYRDHILLAFQNVTELSLTYLTRSLLESSGDEFFILDLSQVDSTKKSVLVKLPEGATLKHALDSPQPSIIPKTSDVATDGKRLIVHWDESDITKSEAVMIIYDLPRKGSTVMIIILSLLVLASISAAVYYYLHKPGERRQEPAKPGQKEKPSEKMMHDHASLTRNLFEEEKLIVEVLLKEPMKELWQKQLELKTGLAKVKLSRKLRSLEQKGLIEKIPYGNTNKIRLRG